MNEISVGDSVLLEPGDDPRFTTEGASAWCFFALTYAFSWTLWTPFMFWLRSRGQLGVEAGDSSLEGLPIWIAILWLLGSWGPSLVGLALVGRAGGRQALRNRLRRALDWRVGGRWHAVTWLGPILLALAAIGLYLAGGGDGVTISVARLPLAPVALLLALPFGPVGEEFGWRGYALPRLQTSSSALSSAVVVGVAWTSWHLPLFWAPLGTTISGSVVTATGVGHYLVEVVALSILMTWLFNNTRGSLLIAIGAHAAWNAGMERFFFEPFASETATALWPRSTAVLFVTACIVIGVFGARRFVRSGNETR